MGLLDDAIREHLELKRRHGAAEEEVRRQEQEALGPPRRGEVPEPLSPPAAGESGPELESNTPVAEEEDLEATVVRPPEPPAAPEEDEEPPTAAYAAPPPREPSPYADEPWLTDATEPDPGPGAVSPGTDPQPAEEDVLEETPDFLQETPEHDRLWFEQKPPKDFDFDK